MKSKLKIFPKTPTGINGLDEIMHGGFPKGRPVLICGSAGCGKTLFSAQFLVKGIIEHNEPGVFMSFEETVEDLEQNVASLGFDLQKLIAQKKLVIDHVYIERAEIEESGEYDLEALFIRLNHAIDSVGAKRVVLDTIESLFSGVNNLGVLRSELRRLFRWLKDKGVTAIITGEKGGNFLTRHGLEEYVSDCVILLDVRVIDQITTRRLRIVKYRGSTHGTNEYPFLIDEEGISVIPITSLKLDYPSTTKIISTGLPDLDHLFSAGGIYKGSSTLITGTSGTAKTILAAHYAMNACLRKERVLFCSFEESPDQMIRNMRTIGLDLKPQIAAKRLLIHASRPSLQGLEMHLLVMNRLMKSFKPHTIIVDPISSLITIGSGNEVRGMLMRLMDSFKNHNINAVLTSVTQAVGYFEDLTIDAVSSLSDNWINLKNEEAECERKRSLFIIKARGLAHDNNEHEFTIGKKGIRFAGPRKK